MQPSSTLSTLARALFAVIGIGAVLLAAGNLASGQSPTDLALSGGLVLGALMLGAAAWVEAPDRIRAIVVWFGIGGAIAAVAIFVYFALPLSSNVIALIAIPSLLIMAAGARLAFARVATGAFGR
ncbi:MAG: hypothetical protein H0W98_02270 [Chloroflexi bacterium]|nr:hypothetical protein [Chloroflexota bacterium]